MDVAMAWELLRVANGEVLIYLEEPQSRCSTQYPEEMVRFTSIMRIEGLNPRRQPTNAESTQSANCHVLGF